MKREGIGDVRARRFDSEAIWRVEFSERRAAEADGLCDRLRKVFANVGVGLFEGQAIDNCETDEGRRQKREREEKE